MTTLVWLRQDDGLQDEVWIDAPEEDVRAQYLVKFVRALIFLSRKSLNNDDNSHSSASCIPR